MAFRTIGGFHDYWWHSGLLVALLTYHGSMACMRAWYAHNTLL